jgi:hypothetical protein
MASHRLAIARAPKASRNSTMASTVSRGQIELVAMASQTRKELVTEARAQGSVLASGSAWAAFRAGTPGGAR